MAQESEDTDSKIARANKMLEDGDFDGALAIWKKLTLVTVMILVIGEA